MMMNHQSLLSVGEETSTVDGRFQADAAEAQDEGNHLTIGSDLQVVDGVLFAQEDRSLLGEQVVPLVVEVLEEDLEELEVLGEVQT
jgi:hypothetical protein